MIKFANEMINRSAPGFNHFSFQSLLYSVKALFFISLRSAEQKLTLISFLPVYASKTSEQEFVTETFKGEIIIPHTDAETTGKWNETAAVKGYDGGTTLWANGKGHSITYSITGIKAGNYELYNWVCPHNFNAPTIEGTVKCKDK